MEYDLETFELGDKTEYVREEHLNFSDMNQNALNRATKIKVSFSSMNKQ